MSSLRPKSPLYTDRNKPLNIPEILYMPVLNGPICDRVLKGPSATDLEIAYLGLAQASPQYSFFIAYGRIIPLSTGRAIICLTRIIT